MKGNWFPWFFPWLLSERETTYKNHFFGLRSHKKVHFLLKQYTKFDAIVILLLLEVRANKILMVNIDSIISFLLLLSIQIFFFLMYRGTFGRLTSCVFEDYVVSTCRLLCINLMNVCYFFEINFCDILFKKILYYLSLITLLWSESEICLLTDILIVANLQISLYIHYQSHHVKYFWNAFN